MKFVACCQEVIYFKCCLLYLHIASIKEAIRQFVTSCQEAIYFLDLLLASNKEVIQQYAVSSQEAIYLFYQFCLQDLLLVSKGPLYRLPWYIVSFIISMWCTRCFFFSNYFLVLGNFLYCFLAEIVQESLQLCYNFPHLFLMRNG